MTVATRQWDFGGMFTPPERGRALVAVLADAEGVADGPDAQALFAAHPRVQRGYRIACRHGEPVGASVCVPAARRLTAGLVLARNHPSDRIDPELLASAVFDLLLQLPVECPGVREIRVCPGAAGLDSGLVSEVWEAERPGFGVPVVFHPG